MVHSKLCQSKLSHSRPGHSKPSHSELLPIPPRDTATDPVHSASDLRQRWRALMGELGFGEYLLWIGFIGPDHRLMKAMTQFPIGRSPETDHARNLMSAMRTLLDDMPAETTVALLLTGPGRGDISPTQREWARLLAQTAQEAEVPLEPMYHANDEVIRQLDPT